MVRQLVLWARGQSSHLVDRARALRELNRRWTVEALQRLDLDGRAMWQQLVREHVTALANDASVLRLQLEPALKLETRSVDEQIGPPPSSVTEARAAVEAMCTLVEVTDRDVQSWLRPATDSGGDGTQRFDATDHALRSIERQAGLFGELWRLEP
jgi:hypothetical protein